MNEGCPVCGLSLKHTSYRDGIFGGSYTVEEHYNCPAGHYEAGYSYGLHDTKINDRAWTWHDSMPSDDVAKILNEIEAVESDLITSRSR